jgi:hypothetical protein
MNQRRLIHQLWAMYAKPAMQIAYFEILLSDFWTNFAVYFFLLVRLGAGRFL